MPADKIYRRQLVATPYVLFAKVSIILFMCKFLRIFHSFFLHKFGGFVQNAYLCIQKHKKLQYIQ